MDPLIIKKTEETPSVILDKGKGIFQLSETSYPEDAKRFYVPILDWIEKYFQSPNPETVFEFNLSYFNTSSAKMITKILNILKEHTADTKLTIKWYYEADDTDMQKSGIRYSQLSGMEFEIIELNE